MAVPWPRLARTCPARSRTGQTRIWPAPADLDLAVPVQNRADPDHRLATGIMLTELEKLALEN